MKRRRLSSRLVNLGSTHLAEQRPNTSFSFQAQVRAFTASELRLLDGVLKEQTLDVQL